MTLEMCDKMNYKKGREEGRGEEAFKRIKKMLSLGYSREQLLTIGYTDGQIAAVEEKL